jgi:hypothetical protein
MTPVEFLAERYNYITWMRNRDEISAGTADEWREQFLKEAIEKQKDLFKAFYIEGAMNDMFSCNMDINLDIEDKFNRIYQKFTL